MVTDYECWREDSADIDIGAILAVMRDNVERARTVIAALARMMGGAEREPSPIDTCLDTAIITAPEHWDQDLVRKLDAICARRFGRA
jgi:5'-methylthioadenosine phosphorylase